MGYRRLPFWCEGQAYLCKELLNVYNNKLINFYNNNYLQFALTKLLS